MPDSGRTVFSPGAAGIKDIIYIISSGYLNVDYTGANPNGSGDYVAATALQPPPELMQVVHAGGDAMTVDLENAEGQQITYNENGLYLHQLNLGFALAEGEAGADGPGSLTVSDSMALYATIETSTRFTYPPSFAWTALYTAGEWNTLPQLETFRSKWRLLVSSYRYTVVKLGS